MWGHVKLPGNSSSFTEIAIGAVEVGSCTGIGHVSSVLNLPTFVVILAILGPSGSHHFPLKAGLPIAIGASITIVWTSVDQELEVLETKGFIVCMLVQ